MALLALDAKIVTTKRTMDAEAFFSAGPYTSTVLAEDEIVIEIQIPKPAPGARQRYLKFVLRQPVDFAIISVASVLTVRDGTCADARLVLGGVAPAPLRAKNAEQMLVGRPIEPGAAAEAAEAAMAGARRLTMNAYKIEIAKTIVKRAVMGEPLG